MWDQRYGRLTRTRLLLSFSQTETVREDIPLEDIDILSSDVAEREESITLNSGLTLGDDGKAPGDRKEENDTSKVLQGLVWSNCFRIFAAKYRRNYYLRTKSEEERDAWLEAIRDQKQILHEESIRASQKTLAQKIRPKVKALVSSVQFQSSVAVLLFCNFLLNIYEVETKADESTKEAHILKILDYSFTVVYVIELLCNLFAHWWRDFLYNGWSVFDAVCVLSSLIGMLLTAIVGEGMDLSIVRSLRIFKIVRIFSRLKSLQVLDQVVSRPGSKRPSRNFDAAMAARVGADRWCAHFQNRATQTPADPTFRKLPVRKRVGTQAGNARRALGRGTHVSEKDFLVFLCRLETAIRAASCGGGRIGEVRAGRSALRTFGKSDIRVDNVERGQKPKFFRAKRSRRRRARGGFDVPARSRGAWRSSTRRSPRRAHPARWW